MIGLSIINLVLIIAAAILQVLLIIKFWKMCNDIRALKNHFIQVPQSAQSTKPQSAQSTKPQSGEVSGVGWWLLGIFGTIILLVVIFAK